MPVVVNRTSTKEEEAVRIDKYYEEAWEIFKGYPSILDSLQILKTYGHEMLNYVEEFDVVPGIQANGFRSILSMGIGLVSFGVKEAKKGSLDLDDFIAVLQNYKNAIPYIERVRKEAQERKSLELSAETMADYVVDYMFSLDVLKYFFTKTGCYDLGPVGSWGAEFLLSMRARSVAPSFLAYLRVSFDKGYRKDLIAKSFRVPRSTFTSEDSKDGIGLMMIRSIIPWYVNGLGRPDVVTDIQVPRQKRVVIKVDKENTSSYIEDTRATGFAADKITCRFIRKSQETPEALMINIHGGGFMIGNRFSHDQSLRKWVCDVPKFAAISIEYSLAPNAKYPTALQECLDVYLFFADPDNREEVKELLGFTPKSILISGDSAGGTLSLGLCLALSRVRKMLIQNNNNNHSGLTLPTAVFTFYPLCSLYPAMKPSFMINATSGLIMPTGPNLMIRAYVPKGIKSETTDRNENVTVANGHRASEKSGKDLVKVTPSGLNWWLSTEMEPKMRELSEGYYRNVALEYPLTKDPLVSPLYGDFNDLSSVTLYAYACRMDGLLDECLLMANRWPGKKNIFVVNNLQHGFLNTGMMSNAVEAMELIGKHIAEAIESGSSNCK